MVTKMSDGRAVKRTAVFFLMIGMLFCVSASMGVSARSAPKLSQKKITIYMGKTGGFHVKNTKKKVQFSSSDKSVVAIKRRSKTRVILAPKRPGRAVITAKVSGRKLKCSVTVKYKKYKDIYVRIGSKDFAVRLYDNKSARMFYKRLPITIDMSDLNGNEKYYYLRGSLPSSDIRVKRIKTGDFMLYDSDCLVLFYKNFTTTYSYTPLGKIKDIRGYAAALKGGSMKVRFRAKKEQTAALSASDTTTKASPIPKETQTPDAGPTSVPEQT